MTSTVRIILTALILFCLPLAHVSAQANKTRVPKIYMPGEANSSKGSIQQSKSLRYQTSQTRLAKAPTPLQTATSAKRSVASQANYPTRLGASVSQNAPSASATIDRRSNRIASRPVTIPAGRSAPTSTEPRAAASHSAPPLPNNKPSNAPSQVRSQGCACNTGGCDCIIGGCDCSGGGCDCDGGCQSCDSGLCDCSNCSCDRPGRSFFGRDAKRGPFSFSVSRSNTNTAKKNVCTCGYADRNPGGLGRRLGSFLPVKVSVRTNHEYRYISPFVGYFDLQDYRGTLGADGRLIDFNDGWQAGVKIGRAFANGIRVESEYSFRHATVDSDNLGSFVGPDFVPTTSFDAVDDLYVLSSITNVLIDLKQLCRRGYTPYVGFGAGGAYVNGDIVTPGLGRADAVDDTTFAYQFIAGVSKRLNRHVEGFAEYKYFGTTGVDVEDAAGVVFERDFPFQSDNVLFGLRIAIPNSRGCTCNNRSRRNRS